MVKAFYIVDVQSREVLAVQVCATGKQYFGFRRAQAIGAIVDMKLTHNSETSRSFAVTDEEVEALPVRIIAAVHVNAVLATLRIGNKERRLRPGLKWYECRHD